MNRYRIISALAVAIALSGTVAHAGDPEAGKAKITICVSCHGMSGKAIAPNYPNLAGQNEKYLVEAIKAYKSGARSSPIMAPMVAALSDQDIENVAAYYAAEPACP